MTTVHKEYFVAGDQVVAYPRKGLRVEGLVTRVIVSALGDVEYMVNTAGPFPQDTVRRADGSS